MISGHLSEIPSDHGSRHSPKRNKAANIYTQLTILGINVIPPTRLTRVGVEVANNEL